MGTTTFLTALEAAADAAETAEVDFQRRAAEQIRMLEEERAFAYRRLNLMRAVADVVASAEDEEAAAAAGAAIVRSKLGWESESEARSEVLASFAPVARAAFASLSAAEGEEAREADVPGVLAAFEAWYLSARQQPFWRLFEQYVPEMPLVER